MSRLSKPNGMTAGMTQFDEITKAYRDALPHEFAGAVNLMAHPMAGFAAAGAIGFGMASHAMGVWMGAVAGLADASQKLLADAADVPARPLNAAGKLKLVSSTPASDAAAAAARTVVAEARRMARATVKATAGTVEPQVVGTTGFEAAAVAKAGATDDLKAISGIGPKLEKVLKGLGIATYEQVARLSKAEIAKLDNQLGFSGRIERDDWIGQANRLAAGK